MDTTITITAKEWQAQKAKLNNMEELLLEVRAMLSKKPVQREWVPLTEFIELTGKKRHQANHILSLHPEWKRTRAGEGVQVNWKKYQETYCK